MFVFVESFVFSTSRKDLIKQKKIYFFLPNLDTFYSFFLPNALATTSNSMFNKRGKNGHPGVVPALEEKPSSVFSPLNMMSDVCFLIYGLYYVRVVSFYLQFSLLSVINMKAWWICQMPFLYQLRCSCVFFIIYYVTVVYRTGCFLYDKLSLLFRDKFQLVMMHNSFNIVPNLVYWDIVEDFCINVHQEYWSVVFL